ncbi:hypothetical protein MKW94_009102 [Papaver nudicaule]|uniref:CS domain-containing protein n=1 Tax=Papaver nudicaule TaxID=74823 RepID=A0AA41UYK0_PAPNU|nr:hypothetical protein [Papaver nudicaule]
MAIISEVQEDEQTMNNQEIMQKNEEPSSSSSSTEIKDEQKMNNQEIMQKEEPSSSSSSSDDKPKKEESNKRVLNKGNGLDMDKYSWTQNLQDVTINIPVPQGTRSKSVSCEIKKNHLKVGLKGQPCILEGDFFQSVKVVDSVWTLEDSKVISIQLTKQNQKDWWKYLVQGEPEIDTQKCEPETSKISDLDSETRSVVEKMMFDQRQKEMGLPTSEETQQQEMMKKFEGQFPDFMKTTSEETKNQEMMKMLMAQNPDFLKNMKNAKPGDGWQKY